MEVSYNTKIAKMQTNNTIRRFTNYTEVVTDMKLIFVQGYQYNYGAEILQKQLKPMNYEMKSGLDQKQKMSR